MIDVSKSFPGVKALDNVNLRVRPHSVHALMGENGAGKSTLLKCLFGIYEKDQGKIFFKGEEINFTSSKEALENGVSMVHQELNLVLQRTVMDNMWLGRYPTKGWFIDHGKMYDDTKRIFDELDIDIDPRVKVGTLSVSQMQMIEIAKAFSYDAKIVIMDEPTSSLTEKEVNHLFKIINKLKEKGCGIVYISHRLEELKAIVDRVTIMRDGQYITDGNFADMTMDQIIANMVGREIKEQFPRVSCPKGKKIFEVKNLNAGHLVRDINFSLYEGEIVGFAGLMGAGRTETTRAIFGVDPKTSGEIWLDGKEVKITCPMDAIKAGIVLAPEDRKKDGLCTKLSIRHNLALPNLDLICSKLGVISSKKEDDLCEKAVKDLLIKTPTVEVNAGNLSGGNQQKVVVGKWLARNSRVVIFDEPTRGIDVGAKVEIYNLMNQLKKQGIAVMFVSSEMPEVLGIADRVIVMCDGKITGEVMAKETSQNEVLKFATEFEKKQQVS